MIEMKLKPSGSIVQVYRFLEDGNALIFDPDQYASKNQGLIKVSWRRLIPKEYPVDCNMPSKSKRNKAKARMKLIEAIWETTDGVRFKHEEIEDAIAHELSLMNIEQQENEQPNIELLDLI